MKAKELKAKIVKEARSLGLAAVGVARAQASEHRDYLSSWLGAGYNGSMEWMHRHFEKRVDPSKLVPGAKTVLVVADAYLKERDEGGEHIARYAQGRDYHRVLKNRMHLLFGRIKEWVPTVKGRLFVDSAPVLEHYWAEQAGVGWIGKNTLTITKAAGSFVFLGEILSDLELPPDPPATNHCGTCTACLDACPTNAFPKPYVLDANKCISYLTIEHREDFTPAQAKSIGEHVYGCDICLEVCPWNHEIKVFRDEEYGDLPVEVKELSQLSCETEVAFEKKYGDSPLTRAGFAGVKRNFQAVLGNRK